MTEEEKALIEKLKNITLHYENLIMSAFTRIKDMTEEEIKTLFNG